MEPDLRVVGHDGLVDRAGVVVQAPGDGQVHGEVVLGDPEVRQVLHHGLQLVQALVEGLVLPPVALQSRQDLRIVPGDSDELQNFLGVGLADPLLHEDGLDLLGADLVQLVHGAHDVPGLLGEAQHPVEAV